MIKAYYELTKPGIIYGNALPAIAGFLLASRGHFNAPLFLAMLAGLSFIIGGSCVVNNYLDRGIDAKMERTKNRALVTGAISPAGALVFAAILELAGTALLIFYTNSLTAAVALVGAFVYIVLYGWSKRRSSFGTLIGAISGAVPPVVGYCTVSNKLDAGAIIFFLILFLWQMPHFYAIAIYRLDEYAAAGIPVLPAKRGVRFTKISILAYVIVFIVATSSLTFFHYTGHVYLTIAGLLGLAWLAFGLKGFRAGTSDKLWARKMFFLSLMVLTLLCVIISISFWIK